MTPDLDWDCKNIGDEPLRQNRFPLMRPVRYERTEAFSDARVLEGPNGPNGMALSINVSSRGMCLLMDSAPKRQEMLRVHVPMPATPAKTPTLAEVCWKRPVPMGGNGLYFVGLRFVL